MLTIGSSPMILVDVAEKNVLDYIAAMETGNSATLTKLFRIMA